MNPLYLIPRYPNLLIVLTLLLPSKSVPVNLATYIVPAAQVCTLVFAYYIN